MSRSVFSFIFSILLMISAVIGCSSAGVSPVVAPDPGNTSSDNAQDGIISNPSDIPLPVSEIDYSAVNRDLLGIWNATFDAEKMTAEVQPDRTLSGHLNVTHYIPAPVIHINGFNPTTGIVDVDFTINNSYSFNGFDVRLIIYTDSVGHMLTNADDWTSLYDVPGGLPINPFRAYSKADPNRKFYGHTTETENLLILLPGGNPNVTFAVDASYPTNCVEPYEINSFTQEPLGHSAGSSAHVQVNVLDWQNNVGSVSLYCPVITGTTLLPFTHGTGNTWQTTLVNNTGASAGSYIGYMLSGSGGYILYDRVTIQVEGNSPPVAVCEADPNPSKGGRAVHFIDGGSYDPDPGDTITTYKWDPDISDGVNWEYEYDEPNMIYHIYENISHDTLLFTARLHVEDNNGGSDECDVEILVEPNTPPVAVNNVIPSPVFGGTEVSYIDNESYDPDSDDGITIYMWDPDIYDGVEYIYSSTEPNQFTHVYENKGTETLYFAARLRVEDHFGGWDVNDVLVEVFPNNLPIPICNAQPNPVQNGVTVNFIDINSYDPDSSGYIVEYAWDYDYDGVFVADCVSDLPNQASHVYTNLVGLPLHFIAAFQVTDNNQTTGFRTIDVTVNQNTMPIADGYTSPTVITSGQTVTFYAQNSYDNDPGDSIAIVEWDFDKQSGNPFTVDWTSNDENETVDRVFYNPGPGSITVTSMLRVYDQYGKFSYDTVSVTVKP
jgi:hypothetical protein